MLDKNKTWLMFNKISSRYDWANSLLSMGIHQLWRRFLSKRILLRYPKNHLDVATGTGDVIYSILREKTYPFKKMVGIDMASEMLKIAKKKKQAMIPWLYRDDHLDFSKGDALSLDFEDNCFDSTSIVFGIRNTVDYRKALNEMYRVIKPEGYAYVLEFSIPKQRFFRSIYLIYMRYILPFLGGLFSGNRDAYIYLNQSIEEFPDGEAFKKEMLDIGFSDVKLFKLSMGIVTLYEGKKLG